MESCWRRRPNQSGLKIKEWSGKLNLTAKGLDHLHQSGAQKQKEKRKETWSWILLDGVEWRFSGVQKAAATGAMVKWDNTLQKSHTWNVMWHMVPLRISFLIRSVYESCLPMQIWCGVERRKTPLVRDAKARRPQSLSWILARLAFTGPINIEA